jgi:N6-L-threonylcarbamoyladenine synthase
MQQNFADYEKEGKRLICCVNQRKNQHMIILGIETSCDETAVALVRDDKTILSHHILSQLEEHQIYGGVVPEIAARSHLLHLGPLIQATLKEADIGFEDLDGIAATCGPGLIGGVMVGALMAKAIAAVHNKPFLAINHLAAHALTPRLTSDLAFSYLLLLVSGGHCQLVIVKSAVSFQVLGSTQDDAVGECFDKCAKLLGLPYPGGPAIEQEAKRGDAKRFSLPTPLKGKRGVELSFSFSGLKSAVLREVEKLGSLTPQDVADLSASLQVAVGETLKDRLKNALEACRLQGQPLTAVVCSGGVAANVFLRDNLTQVAQAFDLPFIAPPIELCTDNGAMVAWAGIEKRWLGLEDSLDFKPRPRWPLTELGAD